jgi:hypothetical protein
VAECGKKIEIPPPIFVDTRRKIPFVFFDENIFYFKEGCVDHLLYQKLNYVLARNSVVFQFDSAISNISYLTCELMVDNQRIEYKKIKKEILLNTTGIICENNRHYIH